MKKLLLSVIAVFAIMKCFSQQSHSFTLRQCIETGIANNTSVGQSLLQVQTDSIYWKQAKWDRFPSLNGFVNQGINQGRSIDPFTNSYINQQLNYTNYSLSSDVILFNGFSLQNRTRQYESAYKASRADWAQAKDNVTVSIILAYLQVLTNEDLLVQLQSQAALTKKQVERSEVLNKEGAIPPPQLYDLKGQYANDQLTIVNVQNSLAMARSALCQLMNIVYDPAMKLERMNTSGLPASDMMTPDMIYENALQTFPMVHAAALRVKSSELFIKSIRGELFPSLVLSGSASTNYSNAARRDVFVNNTLFTSTDFVTVNNVQYPVLKQQSNYNQEKIPYNNQLKNNLFTSVSLSLRVPLFNSSRVRNRIKLAKISLQNNSLAEKSVQLQLRQSVDQAYIQMQTAHDRYKILLEQVNAFTVSFRAAEIRFNNGVGNSIDYLTAKNNLDRTQTSLITTGYDLLFRTKIIDYYRGKALW